MLIETTAIFDYTPDKVGTETLTLTVTDNDGATDTDTMKVTVTDPSAPPPAGSFSDDFSSSNALSEYTTGGSGSWSYDGTNERARVSTNGGTGFTFSHALSSANEGTFTFDVRTISYNGSEAEIELILYENANTYYKIINRYGGSRTGGITKYINGTRVDSRWFKNKYAQKRNYTISVDFSPSSTTVNAFGQKLTINNNHTPITVTSFRIRTKNQDAAYDNIAYLPSGTPASNIPPTAEAGSDKSTEVNHPVTITGNGSDPDGTIVSYEWKKGSMVLATTATFDYTPDTVGTDTLTLTVTDNDGATDTDTMKVTVTDPNAPPADEYTRANEIVTDHVRGLQWQDTSYSQADKNTYNSETSESQRARQWIHAEAYCSSLNLEGGGWRLPTINELDTLIDHDETNPAINPIFQNALGLGTWSGTTYQENTSQAWGIGFYSGGWHHCTKNNKSKLIMCVRDMTSN
jgi:hypothetical protein